MGILSAKVAAWTTQHVLGVSNLVCIATAGTLAFAAYELVLDNAAPISIETADVLNSQPVPRLDVLRIRYKVTVYRACRGEGRRVFIDAAGITQPTTEFRTDSGQRADGQPVEFGEPFDETIGVTVPSGAAPGHATYQGSATFYCNFFQHLLHRGITFEYPTVGFTIGENTLPYVVPSTGLFKHRSGAAENLANWVRHRVGWYEAQ